MPFLISYHWFFTCFFVICVVSMSAHRAVFRNHVTHRLTYFLMILQFFWFFLVKKRGIKVFRSFSKIYYIFPFLKIISTKLNEKKIGKNFSSSRKIRNSKKKFSESKKLNFDKSNFLLKVQETFAVFLKLQKNFQIFEISFTDFLVKLAKIQFFSNFDFFFCSKYLEFFNFGKNAVSIFFSYFFFLTFRFLLHFMNTFLYFQLIMFASRKLVEAALPEVKKKFVKVVCSKLPFDGPEYDLVQYRCRNVSVFGWKSRKKWKSGWKQLSKSRKSRKSLI